MRWVLVLTLPLALLGCRDDFAASCEEGHENCACAPGDTCLEGLTCLSNTCVDPDATTGAGTGSTAGDGSEADGTGADGGSSGADGGSSGASTGTSAADDGSSSTAADSGGTSSGETDGDNLMPLDDEFDDDMVDPSWLYHNYDRAWVSEAGDGMVIVPHDMTQWWDGSQSIMVYKHVSGDFHVSAPIDVSRADMGLVLPIVPVAFAGLMARNPETATENYVAGLLGVDATMLFGVEGKTTTDSMSMYETSMWPGNAELRLCRVGSTFQVLANNGSQWLEMFSYERPDLPYMLEVGMVAYSNNTPADFESRFERINFVRITDVADCSAG